MVLHPSGLTLRELEQCEVQGRVDRGRSIWGTSVSWKRNVYLDARFGSQVSVVWKASEGVHTTVKMPKNKSHHTYVSRAHVPPYRTSHTPPAYRTYLPLIAQTPRFSLGEVFCPGLDGAGSRGSMASFFIPFRGSLEVVSLFFCRSRVAGLSEVRDPITSTGFRLHPKARQPTDAGPGARPSPSKVPSETWTSGRPISVHIW